MEELDLYILALSLVDDISVAGDLFMEARSRAHLRRLAARWRRRNRLPELPVPPPQRNLNDEQREFGLHLVGRRAKRRRFQAFFAAVAGLFLFVTVTVFAYIGASADPLVRDPAYQTPPLATSEGAGGVHFEVYRMEAIPGTVTAWWSITGADAGRAAPPEIAVRGGRSVGPMSVDTTVQRSGRILGKSVYEVMTVGGLRVWLSLQDRETKEEFGRLNVEVTRGKDPAARAVTVNQPVVGSSPGDAARGTIVQVTLGTTYTIVRYRPVVAPLGGFTLVADGEPVRAIGWQMAQRTSGGDQEFAFGPVRRGAASLVITPATPALSSVTIPAGSQRLITAERDDQGVRWVVALPRELSAPRVQAEFVDAQRKRYAATAQPAGSVSGQSLFSIRTAEGPPDAEIVEVQVSATRPAWTPIVVDLTSMQFADTKKPGG